MKTKVPRKPVAVGVFQSLPFPSISRYLARMGWDWILLDAQHGAFSPESIYECVHTIQGTGSNAFVRVAIADWTGIQKALDAGAQGVVVPMINSRAEAELAAQAAKYPPLGGRSIGGDFCFHLEPDHIRKANRRTSLLVQIEHISAVEAAEEILSVEGVDGCLVGPSDLALSLGLDLVGFEKSVKHRNAVEKVAQICRTLGKPAYIHCGSLEEAQERLDQGFHFINLSGDIEIFLGAAENLLKNARTQLKHS